MVQDRLWYRTDCTGLASCHAVHASFILYVGNFRLGGVIVLYMFKFDWSALMTPQKANLDIGWSRK
jgi:hypothetical protein